MTEGFENALALVGLVGLVFTLPFAVLGIFTGGFYVRGHVFTIPFGVGMVCAVWLLIRVLV